MRNKKKKKSGGKIKRSKPMRQYFYTNTCAIRVPEGGREEKNI